MGEEERRRGPSNFTLSLGGLVAVIGLLGSWVATYNSLQNDISILKNQVQYQRDINSQAREERLAIRAEFREIMKEFNEKLDRIIEKWPNGGK